MEIERRSGGNQISESLDEALNEMQLLTLRKMEEFGWRLAFVRRPLFQDIVPVLFHPDNKMFRTLDDDGVLYSQSCIEFR